MPLKVHNTLTRQREEFVPQEEGRVGMYVCGPTVYGHAHLGHAKSYVSFDVIVRYLRHVGYQVRYVQNITDVGHLTDDADDGEDKIAKRAALEKVQPMELVETYMRSYFEDMDALNCLRPDISPRASGHVPEMIALIEKLLAKGYAYEAKGSVYFDVSKWRTYGALSGRNVEEMEAGARVEVNEEKKAPADFALWKRAEPGHIMRWNSPWGEGFPGWHIECSVMSMKYLGETLDIHGGGLENSFPHHECEIAQSEAATGKPFVRYWLHNNMVTVDGTKMGKSLGNFVTLKDAFAKHSPMTVRLFVLTTHYRSNLDYSDAALEAADKGRQRLLTAYRLLMEKLGAIEDGEKPGELPATLAEHRQRFMDAMDEDFNTAGALAALFDFAHEANGMLASPEPPDRPGLLAIQAAYDELAGDILGLVLEEEAQAGASLENDLIQLLIDTRKGLREAKQYDLADQIRDRLAELKVQLEDKPEGTVWRKA